MSDCKGCNLPRRSGWQLLPDTVIDPKHFGPVLYAHSCSPHVSKVKRFGFGRNYVNFGNANFRETR